jgi:hypothetical protein
VDGFGAGLVAKQRKTETNYHENIKTTSLILIQNNYKKGKTGRNQLLI